MTISAKDSAVADLRRLLNDLNVDAPFVLADLERPYAASKPTSAWLWHADQPATVPGLRSPDAYQLRATTLTSARGSTSAPRPCSARRISTTPRASSDTAQPSRRT